MTRSDDLERTDLIAIAKAAKALLGNAGGLLLPYKAYKDGATIQLQCPKGDLVALDDALNEAGFEVEYRRLR